MSTPGTIEYMKWREKAIAMPPGRPRRAKDYDQYRKNYDRIFNRKKQRDRGGR